MFPKAKIRACYATGMTHRIPVISFIVLFSFVKQTPLLNSYVKHFFSFRKEKCQAYRFDRNVKGRNSQYVQQQIGSRVSILFSINYYKIEFYAFYN